MVFCIKIESKQFYYLIGNGMMNIEKAIEDIKFIIETNQKRGD